MDGRSSGESKKGGEGSSSSASSTFSSVKRIAKTRLKVSKERKKGLGIAALERIRIQTEVEEQYWKNSLGSSPSISEAGALSLPGDVKALYTPSPSSHGHHVASYQYPYPCFNHENMLIAYGERGFMHHTQPHFITSRPTGAPGEPSYFNLSNTVPSMGVATLPLGVLDGQEEAFVHYKTDGDNNQNFVDSTPTNVNDPNDLDLELKL